MSMLSARYERVVHSLWLGTDNLEEALATLGATMKSRNVSMGILVAGGSALLLLGLSERPTADLDVVGLLDGVLYAKADPLPAPLVDAARAVGRALGLADTWLNNGPASLMDLGLPPGLKSRVTVRHFDNLEVHIPSRTDQICFKSYAGVDQGPRSQHVADLRNRDPTREELIAAATWTEHTTPRADFTRS